MENHNNSDEYGAMFRIPEGKSVSKKPVAGRRLHWLLSVSRNINITFGDCYILVCELGNTVCFCFCSYYWLILSQGNSNPLFKFLMIMTSSFGNSFVRCEQFSIVVTRLNLIDLNKIQLFHFEIVGKLISNSNFI